MRRGYTPCDGSLTAGLCDVVDEHALIALWAFDGSLEDLVGQLGIDVVFQAVGADLDQVVALIGWVDIRKSRRDAVAEADRALVSHFVVELHQLRYWSKSQGV